MLNASATITRVVASWPYTMNQVVNDACQSLPRLRRLKATHASHMHAQRFTPSRELPTMIVETTRLSVWRYAICHVPCIMRRMSRVLCANRHCWYCRDTSLTLAKVRRSTCHDYILFKALCFNTWIPGRVSPRMVSLYFFFHWSSEHDGFYWSSELVSEIPTW